ncbi:NlpC/P60 family protein [Streptomyces sp. 8K308]|uniref:C40 family peptidase n=1 Tax=Streptomyces sp. 8K308 TaxID=2530388 RepID=UPI001045638B|nr:C40 family peptidase [Streptomyces sp. 8K308]TDC06959.1 NlpC/P60 family protein [Streptomyces sp. 8K308]
MSPIRYRGRHRKPSRSRTSSLIRGGVLMGTVAVAGAATSPALAAEQPTERTGELPLLDGVLASSAAGAAEATQAYVSQAQLQQVRATAQQQAISQAQEAAAELRAAQEAEAERRAREAAEAEAAARAAAEEEAAREAAAQAETVSAPAETTASAPASGGVAAVLDFVRAQLGDAYSLGSTGPDAWDCSSLMQAAFSQAGVSLPRVSQDQSTAGTQVSLDALLPGDILYWGGAGSAYHVAVYVGDGTFIGAQNSSTGVVQRDLDWDPPSGAVRVL